MESATTCDGSGGVEATRHASLNQGHDGTASEQLKVAEIDGTIAIATPTASDKPPLPPKTTYDDYDGYFTPNDDGNDENDDDEDDDEDDDDEDDDENDDSDEEKFAHDYFDKDAQGDLIAAIGADDMPEFVAQLKLLYCLDDFDANLKPGEKPKPNTKKLVLCPEHITRFICCADAVSCASALLQGQTRMRMDLNIPFCHGDYPLHIVASQLYYDSVKLFLSHGARADVTNVYSVESRSLPLNKALKHLNVHKYLGGWTPEESIYKLLIILCLTQMKVDLETIRLLALSTKDAKEVFIDYAKEGQLIEMAVLLLVANERLMAPITCQSNAGAVVEGGMTIRDTIMQDFLSKADEESRASAEKRNKLLFTLILLKIFERAGDAIRSYLQERPSHVPKERVVKDVASILKEAGFVLKEKDSDLSNIDCESDEFKFSGSSERYLTEERRKKMVVKDIESILKEAGFVLEDKDIGLSNILSESNEIQEATVSSENIRADEPEIYPDRLPLDHPFLHTRPAPLGCSVNPHGHPSSLNLLASQNVRKFSDCAFLKHQNNQFKGEKKPMRRSMQPSNSRIALAFLAMSFKRSLRRL